MSYDKEIKILHEINFSIKEGMKIGIIGRTGSGKSTVINALMRFVEDIDGIIKIGGNNVFEINLKYMRNLFTFVSQE